MSEYEELRKSIEGQGKKIDRLLNWAEGDQALGTPSVSQRLDRNGELISETRKIAFKNGEDVNLIKKDVEEVRKDTNANTDDIKNINTDTKKISTMFGAGSGGFFTLLIQAIKAALQ